MTEQETLIEGKYRSVEHKKTMEDFIQKDVIAECLRVEGYVCESGCNKFYECWVEDNNDRTRN